ncbi:hypothetical protein [Clostridium estertheticum]|nr:hypothetical protein [Clostridium estertheticum]
MTKDEKIEKLEKENKELKIMNILQEKVIGDIHIILAANALIKI